MAERGEGESVHSDWEFICHFQAQSYFKRLTRDGEKEEMRPLIWNDMPETTMNYSDRRIVRPTFCKETERDGQLWAAVLQVDVAVKAAAVLSDRSKSPGTQDTLSISPSSP